MAEADGKCEDVIANLIDTVKCFLPIEYGRTSVSMRDLPMPEL